MSIPKLEDLIAQDKVRYFSATLIPAGKDIDATREKYGIKLAPNRSYNMVVTNGTVYYNKADIDAVPSLSSAPNGQVIVGVAWEDIPDPPTKPYETEIKAIRTVDPETVPFTEANFRRLVAVTKVLTEVVAELKAVK